MSYTVAARLSWIGIHGPGRHEADEAADTLSSCARHSFRPDTPVWTAGGLVAISSLEVGEVLAWDEDAGSVGAYAVTATWTHADPLVLKLTLDDGSVVETTPGHPFYAVGAGWTAAGNLAVGSLLVTAVACRSDRRSSFALSSCLVGC